MKKEIKMLLKKADIEIDGSRPWDIKVLNEKFYSRVLSGGSLALGESYMDGWWDCRNLDQFFDKVLRANLEKKIITPRMVLSFLLAKITNLQNLSNSKKHVEHYNIGNDFYSKMLDKNMQYTCAFWKNVKTLEQAQYQKMEMVCKKLKLKKGDRVLEIGSGW